MSTLVPFPRKPLRAALLDFIATAGPRPTAASGRAAEEQEFIDALRRIVADTGADQIRDLFRGRSDAQARIYGRYPD